MSEDPFEQGPECDFCKLAVEPDEELIPLHIGHFSGPKPHYLSATMRKDVRGLSTSGATVLGKSEAELGAIVSALESCRYIDISTARRVLEPEPVEIGEVSSSPKALGSKSFQDEVDDSKAGAEITIRPKNFDPQPSAEVCEGCAEMFKNL